MKALLASALLIGVCGIAFALTPPSDVDLKAAYCIKANQLIITELSGPETKPEMMAQTANNARDRLNRLQSYLLPKLPYLDANGLLAAAKRAEIDGPQIKSLVEGCVNRTPVECQPDHPDAKKCIEQLQRCMSGELNDRWLSCSNLGWLPF